MDQKVERASFIEVKRAFDHFFNEGTSLAKIKDAALGDKLFPTPIHSNGSIGVPGRSIAWKLFLLMHEPLEASPVCAEALTGAIRVTRQAYKVLLLEKMKAPDGSYDADLIFPEVADVSLNEWRKKSDGLSQSVSHPKFTSTGVMAAAADNTAMGSDSSSYLELNNPLSLHDENPWNAWFTSVELRKTISQDVERTFPDIAFFRRPDVQSQLTNILFLFSVQHPSIGYRQGMHELLAPLYHAVVYDSLIGEQVNVDATLSELCSPLWVAADSWALFEAVMRGVSKWYEWQVPSPSSSMGIANDASVSTSGPGGRTSPLHGHVHFEVKKKQRGEMRPYVAPIVKTCNRIQGILLQKTDPQLHMAIQGTGLEPQIYGIRWLRLLFTRELSIPDALRLWDGLFACDPSFSLAQWVCVAMLIRIRNDLIPADYSTQLTLLLRFPSPPVVNTSNPHHVVLLLRQAVALQTTPNLTAGTSLILENQTILGIPIEVPASVPSPMNPRRGHLHRHQMSSAPLSGGGPLQGHNRLSSSQPVGLPEMIARGLMERGESLGINKTLSSALSELKRTIPDLAVSLVRPTNQVEMAFPLEDERPPQERPPWEPKTRFEMERDLRDLRARDKQIGDSLGWIVDVLLQYEGETENSERLKKEKREAIESLAYIRDVLISDAMILEDDRLVGEEASRRRARAQKQEGMEMATSTGPSSLSKISKMVVPPAPLPVVDSRSRTRGSHRPTGLSSNPSVGGEGSLAPWNYTRSSFAGGSALPSAALPRPPPPTSRNLRPAGGRSGDQTPTGGEGAAYCDPLGVMR